MPCLLPPPPSRIPEDKLNWWTRFRLRHADAEFGETLTAEDAAKWTPRAFHHLSIGALIWIPSATLSAIDAERVQQIPILALLCWNQRQLLAAVNKVSHQQLEQICTFYGRRGQLSLLYRIGRKLSPQQAAIIQGCDPSAMAESQNLSESLMTLAPGHQTLALATYYYKPSEQSTAQLLSLSDRELQRALPSLSCRAVADCFSKGGVNPKVAITLELNRKRRARVLSHLDDPDRCALIRLSTLLEDLQTRLLPPPRNSLYQRYRF